MKKYKYPKNKLEIIYYYLFQKNFYLFLGSSLLVVFIIGYLIVIANYGNPNEYFNYRIDSNNRLKKPLLFYENNINNKDIYLPSNEHIDNKQTSNRYNEETTNYSEEDFLFSEEGLDSELEKNNKNISSTSDTAPLIKQFIFGTNSEGRDIFTNLLLGLEIYLIGGALSLIVALFLGISLGSLMAYHEGSALSKIAKFFDNIISSFPKIIILFITLIVFDIGFYPIMIAIGILSSTKISKALSEKIKYLNKSEFIDSAKQIGLSDLNILLRHILFYNCRDIFIVYSIYILADVILLETTLAYLNFGIQWNEIFTGISVKSWGTYLSEGKSYLSNGAYWITLFPALFIVLLILALNFIGDGLKEKFHIN